MTVPAGAETLESPSATCRTSPRTSTCRCTTPAEPSSARRPTATPRRPSRSPTRRPGRTPSSSTGTGPSGSTPFDYRDVFYSAALGTLAVPRTEIALAGGQSTTVTGTLTSRPPRPPVASCSVRCGCAPARARCSAPGRCSSVPDRTASPAPPEEEGPRGPLVRGALPGRRGAGGWRQRVAPATIQRSVRTRPHIRAPRIRHEDGEGDPQPHDGVDLAGARAPLEQPVAGGVHPEDDGQVGDERRPPSRGRATGRRRRR